MTTTNPPIVTPGDQPDAVEAALDEARHILLGLHGLTAFDPAHEAPIGIDTQATVARIEAALRQYRQDER